jgi:ferrochelatase
MPDLGVLLMTYGSPSSLDDVPRYMTAVRGGRAPEPELLTEFKRRYQVIGGSPLVQVTEAQAAVLETELAGEAVVRAGMRFSHPTIEEQLRALGTAGASRVVAIVLSPQYSPLLMSGYGRAIDAAVGQIGPSAPVVTVADAWHLEPDFIGALAHRIHEGLGRLPAGDQDSAPVLLTAHSLPKRVAEREPAYLDQLQATATAVAEAADMESGRWHFCWQSAGHEPGEWMKPDFADLMPELAAAGHRSVLVAPVQFLSDHLEVLYDVDIGAREQAEEHGLAFARIESLNVDPQFIRALGAVARRTAATIQVPAEATPVG